VSCDFNVSKLRQALLLSQKLLKEVEPLLREHPELQAEVQMQQQRNKEVLFKKEVCVLERGL